jgi:hypothetical protein
MVQQFQQRLPQFLCSQYEGEADQYNGVALVFLGETLELRRRVRVREGHVYLKHACTNLF